MASRRAMPLKGQKLKGQIKLARQRAKLTQVDAAESLGVTAVYLSYLENGRSTPSIALLEAMARLYDAEFVIRGYYITTEA